MKSYQKTFPNGLRVVTVSMPDNPTVTVQVMVAAGTRYETKKTNGLSHFLEHMCFKGTARRTNREIAYELESLGAETNAFTDYDYTGYYAKGRADLFPKLLDVVADVYLHSTFPAAEIEKERGVICGEIDMYEDNPQQKVGMLFAESLYGDQPAGYAIIGPKENIKSFTRDDFVNYHRDHYVAQKTIITVTGNVQHADVVREVKKAFASIPSGKIISKKKIAKTAGVKKLISNKKFDQAHIIVGTRSIPAGHPDMPAMRVMTGVIGQGMSSRLFLKLREEMGAGYYLYAAQSVTDDSGDFAVATGTAPARADEVIAAIFGEINRMRTELVPVAELAKSKEYLIGRTYMGLESTDAVAYTVGLQAMFGQPIKLPKDFEKEIRKVTAADVLRVAKKYLKPELFHTAMIGAK